MVGRVQLSFDQRQGLYALQQIDRLVARTDRRLVTQQRLHSPADGVTDYFIAEQLGDTIGILKDRQREIAQGVSALSTTVGGLESIQNFLIAARGIAANALVTLRTGTEQIEGRLQQDTQTFLAKFNNLILVATDTEYLELNLITSTEQRLLVRYSEDRDQLLSVPGRSLFTITTAFETGGLFSSNGVQRGGADAEVFSLIGERLVLSNFLNVLTYPDPNNPGATLNFSFNGFSSLLEYETLGGQAEDFVDAITQNIDRAIDRLEVHERYFANNLAILQTRAAFTRAFSETLSQGRSELTQVDVNEEAVTLSVLQTRNGLAVSSLSLLDERHGQLLRLLQ